LRSRKIEEFAVCSIFRRASRSSRIDRAPIESISGGDAATNARIIQVILSGEKSPRRDVVLLNAAATLVAAGRAGRLSEAMPLAVTSIDSGAAAAKLQALVEFTQRGVAS